MAVKSSIKTDRLYWLGRYSERVYTTIMYFSDSYDKMIENGAEYEQFCKRFDIPNIYTGSDDFLRSYPFGTDNPDSIINNLYRAYDNAIELREEISSSSLSYIQLAIYSISKAAESEAPLIEFQKICDNILAFWGCIDDIIEDENTRNLIKVGKRIERIDLYGRLRMGREDLRREVMRLAGRIDRCAIRYNKKTVETLLELVEEPTIDHDRIVYEVDRILEV